MTVSGNDHKQNPSKYITKKIIIPHNHDRKIDQNGSTKPNIMIETIRTKMFYFQIIQPSILIIFKIINIMVIVLLTHITEKVNHLNILNHIF
jgi:hypothetical protein